ncbi:hypothetical protein UFOVP941_33 [uncultured Caudovirales phage]|uniref:Uncharacterized protein n=1 Tax=uncultured Caudovirales phage TaxID=2100421 RepID=A0A6J5S2M9_9CAUD|nr:hypothetical protein UFOVP941_33 [uncultured Caudovirales phage]CAB4202607.1 hypothetical protein UFOVP1373_28 [uncultured Caudovirales phage]
MILRLTSKEGRLNASFTEKKKPIVDYYNEDYDDLKVEQFESSFQPIQLSEEAREYLNEKTQSIYNKDLSKYESLSIELSEKECEVFEVTFRGLIGESVYTLQMKTIEELKDKSMDGTIIQFLNGSHSFDGYWFGEVRDNKPYWWRSELDKYLEQQLLTLGKELLKVQTEMYNPVFRVEAVSVSEIIKAFDKFGIDLNEKLPF